MTVNDFMRAVAGWNKIAITFINRDTMKDVKFELYEKDGEWWKLYSMENEVFMFSCIASRYDLTVYVD